MKIIKSLLAVIFLLSSAYMVSMDLIGKIETLNIAITTARTALFVAQKAGNTAEAQVLENKIKAYEEELQKAQSKLKEFAKALKK